ncbi:hypothetical protein EFBL_1543 [Effusibacillus lacus]|uniref:Uncharacterized protein n=1 Tax=Effusibacillus lacus TaxID=1348429 RepID=A0A292YIZ6_9BACL|nr:hypothetical protein EFBL_1543 [Effusibacillus lacus]
MMWTANNQEAVNMPMATPIRWETCRDRPKNGQYLHGFGLTGVLRHPFQELCLEFPVLIWYIDICPIITVERTIYTEADGVLVSLPVFKTEREAWDVSGGFDSHTLPPFFLFKSRII